MSYFLLVFLMPANCSFPVVCENLLVFKTWYSTDNILLLKACPHPAVNGNKYDLQSTYFHCSINHHKWELMINWEKKRYHAIKWNTYLNWNDIPKKISAAKDVPVKTGYNAFFLLLLFSIKWWLNFILSLNLLPFVLNSLTYIKIP